MSRPNTRGAAVVAAALSLLFAIAAGPAFAQKPEPPVAPKPAQSKPAGAARKTEKKAPIVSPIQKERETKALAVLARAGASRQEKSDACRELSLVGTRDAVKPLAALLTNEELAHMARYALEPIPDPAVDASLRDALGTTKGRLLVGVIGSLGVRRDRAAVEPLTKLLKDGDAEVASAAARALGRIATPEAAQAIEAALPNAAACNTLPFAEGLFRCVDGLARHGKQAEAVAILDRLGDKALPAQVRQGAERKARILKQEQAKGL